MNETTIKTNKKETTMKQQTKTNKGETTMKQQTKTNKGTNMTNYKSSQQPIKITFNNFYSEVSTSVRNEKGQFLAGQWTEGIEFVDFKNQISRTFKNPTKDSKAILIDTTGSLSLSRDSKGTVTLTNIIKDAVENTEIDITENEDNSTEELTSIKNIGFITAVILFSVIGMLTISTLI